MEEINIFLDNKINIFYLSLFDNYIKDENYFKLGTYILNNNNNLHINYDNGENISYSYIKTDKNIKYYGDLNIIENKYQTDIYIIHRTWEDKLIIDNNICYRQDNNDKGKFILNDNKLIINWDDYDEEIFICNDNDNKYYLEINNNDTIDKNIENNQLFFEIDDDHDVPKNIENNQLFFEIDDNDNDDVPKNIENEQLFFEIDDNNNDVPKNIENDQLFFEIDDNNNDNDVPKNIENQELKLLVKNNSWEDFIICQKDIQECYRQNIPDDKGTYIMENNYLYINWKQWDNETFYKNENYYINNSKLINNYKFILKDYTIHYDIDKEYIYINDEKYDYDLINKKLFIHNYEFNEFIFLDNEYYHIYYFDKCTINNNDYLLFKNENIILNNLHIIISKYEYINNNIINIQWFDNTNLFYKINKDKSIYDIIELNSIKIKEDIIQKYYIYEHLLYDEHFNNFMEMNELNENTLILKNNLKYIKNENDNIFILEKSSINKEVILFDEDFKTYYYDDNYIYNSDSKYLCLIDNDYENIHIKKEGQINIYKRLFENNYFIENEYQKIQQKKFNELIFKYFENHLVKDNLITNITNDYIIYNEDTFNHNFTFLEKIDFNCKNDIFDVYGFLKIEELHMNLNENEELNIINFKNNDNFMKNQDLWITYLKENNKNVILIFDDYNYYEFLNEVFEFENNFYNYVIVINYTKCNDLIHFYLNKMIKNLYNSTNITKINYIIDLNNDTQNINKHEKCIINNEFYEILNSKYDLIVFVIYFYIKNKNIFLKDNNFSISYNLYQNNTFY